MTRVTDKQVRAVFRALAADPKLLVADELGEPDAGWFQAVCLCAEVHRLHGAWIRPKRARRIIEAVYARKP